MVEILDFIVFIVGFIVPQNPEVVDFISGLSFLYFDVNIIIFAFLLPNIIKISKESELDFDLIRIRYKDDQKMYKRFYKDNFLRSIRTVLVGIFGFSIGFLLHSFIGKQANFTMLNPTEFQNLTPIAILYFTLGFMFLLNVFKILLTQKSKIKVNVILTIAILYSYVIVALRAFFPSFNYFIIIFDFFIPPIQTPIKIILTLIIQGVFYYHLLKRKSQHENSLFSLLKNKVILTTTVIALITTVIFIVFDISMYKKVGYLDWKQFDMKYFLRGYGNGYFLLTDFSRYLLQYLTPIFIVGYVLTELSSFNLNFLTIRIGSKKKIFIDFIKIGVLILAAYLIVLFLLSSVYFIIIGREINILYMGLFALEEIFVLSLFLLIFIISKSGIVSFIIIMLLYMTNLFELKIAKFFGFSSTIRNLDGINIIPKVVLALTVLIMIFICIKGSDILWKD